MAKRGEEEEEERCREGERRVKDGRKLSEGRRKAVLIRKKKIEESGRDGRRE